MDALDGRPKARVLHARSEIRIVVAHPPMLLLDGTTEFHVAFITEALGHAATAALEDSGTDPETLDYIIVAHNFGDVASHNLRLDFCPTLAARIKQRLEIRNPYCVAYDLPFGCPGWLQAVIQGHYFLRSGDARKALVVGSETLSRVSDPHDRDSMIFYRAPAPHPRRAREPEEHDHSQRQVA